MRVSALHLLHSPLGNHFSSAGAGINYVSEFSYLGRVLAEEGNHRTLVAPTVQKMDIMIHILLPLREFYLDNGKTLDIFSRPA